jgi:anthranilate/para-aminobenzoate synthase component I
VIETHEGNPLDFIEAYQQRFKVAIRPGMPRFCGGLAGYFGYDTVRHIEKTLANAPKDDLGLPDIQLMVTEELAVIDNLSGKLYLIVYADPRSRSLLESAPAPERPAHHAAPWRGCAGHQPRCAPKPYANSPRKTI